jgi:hypothetical protein
MIEKLKDWLEKQGYSLEMKVTRELFKAGFNSVQSSYYDDPISEKKREIDVVGQLGYTYKDYTVIFQLIIECKNNLSKPWIAFSSDIHTTNEKEFIIQRPASIIGGKYLEFISEKSAFKESSLFKKPSRFAYNITQSFEAESDKVYAALMSVINAVNYRKNKINTQIPYRKHCEIYYPMIIVGGKLFECYLDKDNESCLEEVDSITLLWKNNLTGHHNTIIEIKTFDSFSKKIQNIKTEIDELIIKESNEFFNEDIHYNFDSSKPIIL